MKSAEYKIFDDLSAGGTPGYVFSIRHPDRVWALVAIG